MRRLLSILLGALRTEIFDFFSRRSVEGMARALRRDHHKTPILHLGNTVGEEESEVQAAVSVLPSDLPRSARHEVSLGVFEREDFNAVPRIVNVLNYAGFLMVRGDPVAGEFLTVTGCEQEVGGKGYNESDEAGEELHVHSSGIDLYQHVIPRSRGYTRVGLGVVCDPRIAV